MPLHLPLVGLLRFIHTAGTHHGFEITKAVHYHQGERRKRSNSIFENFLRIIQFTSEVEADLLIHSGDLCYTYYIPTKRLDALIQPLVDLRRAKIAVVIIPGNHERSAFPFDLFQGVSGVLIFDEPKTLCFCLDCYPVGIVGFSFIRLGLNTLQLAAGMKGRGEPPKLGRGHVLRSSPATEDGKAD
jgi:hypothetical protein